MTPGSEETREKIRRERQKLKGQLDWLWANCKIIYYPNEPQSYPIEHNARANKIMREYIEARMTTN